MGVDREHVGACKIGWTNKRVDKQTQYQKRIDIAVNIQGATKIIE